MMLTWKIFVIIISMVSLTLQMNTSHAGSSSGSSQVTDPDSPSDTDSESPWVIDPESGIHYPLAYHNHYSYNPFFPRTNAYKCYEMIRLYCPTAEIGLIGSNDCAKQGIFFYRQKYGDVYGPNKSETHGQKDSVKYGQRESDLCYENNERDPYTWVDKFFYDLHLKPGKFKLPKEFCKGKDVLQNYTSEALCPMWARDQFTNSVSKKEVRLHIAWFALKHRDLFVVEKEIKAKNSLKVFLGVPEEDFETEYLEHISDHVSSNDPEYDPSRFCRKFENSPIKMKFSNFLAKHLKLEPDYY